jgi:hypothetical protein
LIGNHDGVKRFLANLSHHRPEVALRREIGAAKDNLYSGIGCGANKEWSQRLTVLGSGVQDTDLFVMLPFGKLNERIRILSVVRG